MADHDSWATVPVTSRNQVECTDSPPPPPPPFFCLAVITDCCLILNVHSKGRYNQWQLRKVTHTQRRFYPPFFSPTQTHMAVLRHQSMLKIAWPETPLSSTPLLSLSSPSCPPLHYHYKQATVSSFSNNKGWAVTFICISRLLVI